MFRGGQYYMVIPHRDTGGTAPRNAVGGTAPGPAPRPEARPPRAPRPAGPRRPPPLPPPRPLRPGWRRGGRRRADGAAVPCARPPGAEMPGSMAWATTASEPCTRGWAHAGPQIGLPHRPGRGAGSGAAPGKRWGSEAVPDLLTARHTSPRRWDGPGSSIVARSRSQGGTAAKVGGVLRQSRGQNWSHAVLSPTAL